MFKSCFDFKEVAFFPLYSGIFHWIDEVKQWNKTQPVPDDKLLMPLLTILFNSCWIRAGFWNGFTPFLYQRLQEKCTKLLNYWWSFGEENQLRLNFSLKWILICGLCGSVWVLSGTGTVNKDNLQWPGGPKNAVLNCFFAKFFHCTVSPLGCGWWVPHGCWVEKVNAFFIIIIFFLWKQLRALIPNVNFMQFSHGLYI